MPSLDGRQIDLVITTSALHHLPDVDSLQQTFKRLESLLSREGGFYIFDFGLLRSANARKLMVAEVAKLAPPITAKDYELSLQAAFPVSEVLRVARAELRKPFEARLSSFVDFFYFMQTERRTVAPANVENYLSTVKSNFTNSIKLENLMLRIFKRTKQKIDL